MFTLKKHISAAFCVVVALLFQVMTAAAQEPVESQPSNPIEQAIEQSSEGTVNITMPEELQNLIINGLPHHSQPQQARPHKHKVGRAQGWRIQVFSDGSSPSTLAARARARGNAVAARFPKYRGQIYTFSTSPNWYCRVGNFRTAAEANAALMELKRAFPSFASEMRTVKCTVILR